MRLLFMGPPGAGKGTQAQILLDELKIIQISTGDMLREAIHNKTEMGLKAKEYMNRGDLVPDAVVIGIVRDRISQDDAGNGYILDGFPRTLEQADALEKIMSEVGQKLDLALNLSVPDDELVRRLLERARIQKRPDDTKEVIVKRLHNYQEHTRPLLDYYKKKGILREIDGVGTLDQVKERMLLAVDA